MLKAAVLDYNSVPYPLELEERSPTESCNNDRIGIEDNPFQVWVHAPADSHIIPRIGIELNYLSNGHCRPHFVPT